VIVATSNGAPLSIWLAQQPDIQDRLSAVLFMSPNFRVRNPFGFLLTWPWSNYWIDLIVGKNHEWEPINEEQGKYWTNSYSTRALQEMQSVVDWVRRQDLSKLSAPLALMYSNYDQTIHPQSAVAGFHAWGSEIKELIEVEPDGQAEHVFVGDITAPQRTDWVVEQFVRFLEHRVQL